MAARTDHDRRDAQHAARSTIAIAISRYIRRMTEEAYAHIEEEATRHDGITELDWSEVGRTAAHRALGSYGISVGPQRAIDADDSPALPAGADREDVAQDA